MQELSSALPAVSGLKSRGWLLQYPHSTRRRTSQLRYPGDWYVAVDVGPASKAAIELILSWAKEEGEPIVSHPQGPLMVRLEWMLSGKDPLMMNFREQCKRALEGVVLQSDS